MILIINLIIPIFPYNNMYSVESNLSIIKLKIKGSGNKKVFSSSSYFDNKYYPNEVHINGHNETTIKPKYDLNQENNNIELIYIGFELFCPECTFCSLEYIFFESSLSSI